MSAAYIQVHFRLYSIMEAIIMSPDQTAPSNMDADQTLQREQSDLRPYCLQYIGYLRISADARADNKSSDWREKG